MSFQYAANVYLQGSTFNISGRDQIVNNYLNSNRRNTQGSSSPSDNDDNDNDDDDGPTFWEDPDFQSLPANIPTLTNGIMSILHASELPTLKKHIDQALACSSAEISPWLKPVAWVQAESEYIDSVLQDVAVLTGNGEIKQDIHIEEIIIYRRLLVYLFSHLTCCVRDNKLLSEFKEKLGIWKTWNHVTMIQNHQQIVDYLRGLFQNVKFVRDFHPESTFESLLAYDVVGLTAHLTNIVTDDNQYKELVVRKGDDAQSLVNLLQARLDFWIHPKYRSRHVKTLVKLSRASACYPACLVLKAVDIIGDSVADGSFGDVYKARLGNQVLALKILKVKKRSEMDVLRKQFSCEAVTWRQISHPNVLPFYGAYHLEDAEPPRLCLAMPWMEHGDMVHFLAEVAPDTDCVLLAMDVAQGLEYLHHKLIVHGDLKGHNILISASGRACLADFGLATTQDSSPVDMTKTTVGSLGTMRWRAPELLQDEGPSTRASDVYSTGMVFYEMFSGGYPFKNLNEFRFTTALTQGKRPPRPSNALSATRGLNDDMWRLIEACWSQSPQNRPAAGEIVETLCYLPNRTTDSRPLDDFNITSSQMWYKNEHHPFSALAPSEEDNDGMQRLKHMSEATSNVYES